MVVRVVTLKAQVERIKKEKKKFKRMTMEYQNSCSSGGGLSPNGRIAYGYASHQGGHSYMEDFYEIRFEGVGGELVGLFGVFDGHAGATAAAYLRQSLFSHLIQHPKLISDTKSAITDAFARVDSQYLEWENNNVGARGAGSTACTAVLVGNRLVVANVGDSRAVVCKGGIAVVASIDHKPNRGDERRRVEAAGGRVMLVGSTWRVDGRLAVSRAFGDRSMKRYVVADPEIREGMVDESVEFIVLASDGLWDVLSNEEAVSIVRPIMDPAEAAWRLMQEAFLRRSVDNTTCLVVRFLTSNYNR